MATELNSVSASPGTASGPEPEPGHGGRIVAGLDSSACSRHAVDWAAAEAVRRGTQLELVHAYQVPVRGYPAYFPDPNLDSIMRRAARDLLDQTAAEVRNSHPGLPIGVQLSHSDAATALRYASTGAALTVVGIRGTGRVAEIVMGSVALAIASDNPAPVAVIHPEHQPDSQLPVVVGVDGSPNSTTAIAFAFAAAELRHVPLLAVHSSWYNTATDAAFPGLRMVSEPLVGVRRARRLLSDELSACRAKYPGVRVIQRLSRTRPTAALLHYCHEAQLVVVGTRGRHGIAGLVLGSTSHALIVRGSCPVVVVRPADAALR
jgi:nucleotide-binding universal stress UspA family protein